MRTSLLLVLLHLAWFAGSCTYEHPAPPLPDLGRLGSDTVRDLARPLLQAVERSPRDPDALGALAQVYEVEAVWDTAAGLYQRAAAADPQNAAWCYHAALCLQRAGRIDSATRLLEDAGTLHPNSAPIQQRLGEALLDEGRSGDARAAFERARAATRDPAPLLGLAEVELAEERPDAAERLARAALERAPDDRRAWFLLGRALLEDGRPEEARPALERGRGAARRALPDAWMRGAARFVVGLDLFFHRANLLRARGDDAEHLALLESGRERYPDEDRVAVNLGVAYLAAGRLDEARAEFDRALELAPESAELALALATLHQVEGDDALALAATRRATEREPGNVGAWTLRARLALGTGAHDEALASCESALAVESGDPELVSLAATSALAARRWAEAIEYLETHLQHVPDAWRPWVQLSLARRAVGDVEGADAAASRAHAIAPDEPAVRALGSGGSR